MCYLVERYKTVQITNPADDEPKRSISCNITVGSFCKIIFSNEANIQSSFADDLRMNYRIAGLFSII